MIKDFYTIAAHTETDADHHRFELTLNQQSCVYQGHFPGRPIAPGVCNIEMIKECALKAINPSTKMRLGSIRSCQMIEVVDPFKTPNLSLTIAVSKKEDAKIEFVGELFHEDTPYMKMKATLINY